MTRHLCLMRHAKSSWNSDAAADFDRPLAGRGRRDAPRMGKWLKKRVGRPDHVVSSTALRARQTTLLACEALGIPEKDIQWEPPIYGGGLRDLSAVLSKCPGSAKRVLLVGHNPGMDELLTYLWGADTEPGPDGKLLTTAAVAVLALPDDWSELAYGTATCEVLVRPRDLSEA